MTFLLGSLLWAFVPACGGGETEEDRLIDTLRDTEADCHYEEECFASDPEADCEDTFFTDEDVLQAISDLDLSKEEMRACRTAREAYDACALGMVCEEFRDAQLCEDGDGGYRRCCESNEGGCTSTRCVDEAFEDQKHCGELEELAYAIAYERTFGYPLDDGTGADSGVRCDVIGEEGTYSLCAPSLPANFEDTAHEDCNTEYSGQFVLVNPLVEPGCPLEDAAFICSFEETDSAESVLIREDTIVVFDEGYPVESAMSLCEQWGGTEF